MDEPFESYFSLAQEDSPLRLFDIIKTDLPQAELAFLSACHSAAGDKSTPDEAVHLAAGMLFAGFRSVVGTMWEIEDGDAPVVVEAFYKHMLRNGPENADYRDAAKALSLGVNALRRTRKGFPLKRWICFVHDGDSRMPDKGSEVRCQR